MEEKFSQPLNNLKHGLKTIKFLTMNYDAETKTFGYNAVEIKKLPITLEKIYIPELKKYCNINNYYWYKDYTLSPVLEKYKHLIEKY